MDWSLAAPAPSCAEQMELHPSSECLFFSSFFYLFIFSLGCSILFCHHLLPTSCDTNVLFRQNATTTLPSCSAALWGSTRSAANTPRPREPSRSSTCSMTCTRASTSWLTPGRTLMCTRLEARTLQSLFLISAQSRAGLGISVTKWDLIQLLKKKTNTYLYWFPSLNVPLRGKLLCTYAHTTQ